MEGVRLLFCAFARFLPRRAAASSSEDEFWLSFLLLVQLQWLWLILLDLRKVIRWWTCFTPISPSEICEVDFLKIFILYYLSKLFSSVLNIYTNTILSIPIFFRLFSFCEWEEARDNIPTSTGVGMISIEGAIFPFPWKCLDYLMVEQSKSKITCHCFIEEFCIWLKIEISNITMQSIIYSSMDSHSRLTIFWISQIQRCSSGLIVRKQSNKEISHVLDRIGFYCEKIVGSLQNNDQFPIYLMKRSELFWTISPMLYTLSFISSIIIPEFTVFLSILSFWKSDIWSSSLKSISIDITDRIDLPFYEISKSASYTIHYYQHILRWIRFFFSWCCRCDILSSCTSKCKFHVCSHKLFISSYIIFVKLKAWYSPGSKSAWAEGSKTAWEILEKVLHKMFIFYYFLWGGEWQETDTHLPSYRAMP